MNKTVFVVGQKINDWTVIEVPFVGKVKVRCLCGRVRRKDSYGLRVNLRCSSCAKRVNAAKISTFDLVIREIFATYRCDAKKDGREFEVAMGERFTTLVTSDCYYCGTPPSRAIVKRGQVTFVTGIDRVDSTRGYTWDNIVPCCTICNRMKNTLPLDEFLYHIEKMYRHLSRPEVKI